MSEKQDSFSTRRSANIDGFFVKPMSGPASAHKPVFRGSTPGVAPASKHGRTRSLTDMPRRGQPQSVLSGSDVRKLPSLQPSTVGANGMLDNQPRRRKAPVNATPGLSEEQIAARPKRNWRKIFKRTGIGVGVVVVLFGLWFGWRFYKDISKLTGNKNPLALLQAFNPAPLKNEDGRVNILVAANSADDPGHGGANLTDSLMILSVDTKNNTALMLSVPRDLWVQTPSGGYSKINALYPNYGMSTLISTLEDDLGMPIHYNVLVSYDAFRDLVNAVGGITITIQSDDPRGIYDPNIDYTNAHCCALAKYPNGPVTLNGQQALNLARARGDPSIYGIPYGFPDGDFDRTEHQRQMIMAIKDKADQPSVIANPFKVADLVDAVGKNVTTDLKLNEIETLYFYAKKINDNDIASYNINTLKGGNTTMLQNYTSPDGQSALIPAAGVDDYSDIQAQIKKILSSDAVTREGASVVVLNGTQVSGLAAKAQSALVDKGMSATVGDAPAGQATTTLIDNSQGKMPNTLAYLKKKYNATLTTSSTLTTTYPNADFILILGQDQAPADSTTTTQ